MNRLAGWIGVCLALSACATSGGPTSYVVTSASGTIGVIIGAATCDRVMMLADTERRVHRVELETGKSLPAWDAGDVQPMAIAADCARQRIWVVSPAKPHGLRAVAIDVRSGERTADYPVSTPCFPTSAMMTGDELFIAGECVLDAAAPAPPSPDSYYRNRRIGIRVNVVSGASREGLGPYEQRCIGAGACVGGSVAATGRALFAALPASSSVGVYSTSGELQRTIPIDSPLFKRDGRTLARTADADERMHWMKANSTLYRIYASTDRLIVVHQLVQIPDDWTRASVTRPQFKAWANVLSLDGEPIRRDVPLGELPVAFDGKYLAVVDYGADGRQGAHERVGLRLVQVVD